jgi:ABC-2 type transport system permease protein
MILVFAQNLLSGVYAPLWYFPDWFVTLSAFAFIAYFPAGVC